MLKIALINIHADHYRVNQTIGATNIAYLAAYLRQYLDTELEIRLDVNTQRLLSSFTPHLIGLSSTTENYTLALRDIQMIRHHDPHVPIVLGGAHISALPQSLPHVQHLVGVVGEGEETFCELVTHFSKQGSLSPQELHTIKGLIFYDPQDQLGYTAPRELAQDMDSYPMPARDLLLSIPERHQPALLTSRGCPFRCTFCSTRMLWKEIRFHSPERVIEELYDILKWFPDDRSIRIDDDLCSTRLIMR
jgi:radical SAM superfamily enzyme YgiQ (UPF0313 family)